jgi:hypothetical protein
MRPATPRRDDTRDAYIRNMTLPMKQIPKHQTQFQYRCPFTLRITTDHKWDGCHNASRSPADPAHLAPQGHQPSPRSPARTDPSLLFGPTAPDLTPPGSHELHYPPCRFPRTLTSRYTPITRPHFLVAPQRPAPLRVSIMATRALSLVRA